jgi:NAD(P)-dependent dehydrogenase (short-subunit alcohol dehydrogenase family)
MDRAKRRRWTRDEQIASERASYVTGTAIQVDGGLIRSIV